MIGVTGVFPIPGKQVGEPGDGNIVDPSDDVSQPGVGIDIIELSSDDQGITWQP